MNFADWMKVDEIQRGPVGGAFGREMKRTGRVNRFNNAFQSRGDRVAFGRGVEDQIFNALVKCGMKLTKPSRDQDRFDKVDAYWQDGNQYHPLQIKYRDTGDDILFEVMVDYDHNVPGRDMVGKATHYAVMSKDGRIVNVIRVEDAKKLIAHMQQAADMEGFDERETFQMRVPGGTAMLRVRPDPASGQRKLIAFIPVTALPVVKSCVVDLTF